MQRGRDGGSPRGRAVSSWAASRKKVASSPKRPTNRLPSTTVGPSSVSGRRVRSTAPCHLG
ncbi:uncharacterized protein STAUR_1416 [Stigmatella aurantiaca DW4/3-1]|nr:uncharacterized protein STAUR_1416 [Stigmatella aurantiaca DW4/3-1]